jgi:hypothetical protein
VKCLSPECGEVFYVGDGKDGRCPGCSEIVWAFNPHGDEWYHVADDIDEIEEGLEPVGDQCDSCGGASYRVVTSGKGAFVRCMEHPLDDDTVTGCGTEYAICSQPTWKVIF